MAIALKEGRAVYGEEIIVERPMAAAAMLPLSPPLSMIRVI